MKRVYIALALMLVLIAIAYVKTSRQYDQAQAAYRQGNIAGQKGLDKKRQEADSLRYHAAQKEVLFADSLMSQDRTHRRETSSLTGRIDSLATEITDLQTSLQKSQELAKKQRSGPKKVTSQKPSRHEQILLAYKKRYQSLPTDLSKYEKRVALAEIRQETVDEFMITMSELEKIRLAGRLNY